MKEICEPPSYRWGNGENKRKRQNLICISHDGAASAQTTINVSLSHNAISQLAITPAICISYHENAIRITNFYSKALKIG